MGDVIQVRIGGRPVGLVGLKKIFEEVQALGFKDADVIRTELLERTRRENYISSSAKDDYADAIFRKYREFMGEEVEEELGVVEIRILGPGCMRCEEMTKRVMAAVDELKLAADVQHIRDLAQIASYGVVVTPVLVINGEVKVVGKVPTVKEIKAMLS